LPEDIPASIQDPEQIASEYIAEGWQEVTGLYTSKAKDKTGQAIVDSDTLKFLGKLRKAMVFQLFECGRRGDADIHLQSFGSDNLTSDFDVTLVGRNACHVMWVIFDTFINKYKSTIPYAFDTNIYSTGTNAVGNSRPGAPIGLERVPFTSNAGVPMFALRPEEGSSGEAASRAWAIAKVVEGLQHHNMSSCGNDVNLDKVFGSENVMNASECLKRAGVMRTAASRVTAAHYELMNPESCAIITEYALQFHHASLLNNDFYEGADMQAPSKYLEDVSDTVTGGRVQDGPESIIDCLCLSMYFSVEAAWTCATINVVVLEMQGGLLAMGSGTKSDYICAMIETYGDFVTHADTGSESVANRANVLKLSKYIYRMLYAAAEATAKTHGYSAAAALRQEALCIKEGVVSRRGKNLSAEVDLKLVYLEPDATPDAYRRVIASKFTELYGSLSIDSDTYGGGCLRSNSPLCVSNIALLMITALVTALPRF
jgi:hypothetical protein